MQISVLHYTHTISQLFLHTIGGSVGLEEIGEQALLDGGVPTQGLFVQDEQEAVELHQELVQHWKHRQKRGSQRNSKIKIPLYLSIKSCKSMKVFKQWL